MNYCLTSNKFKQVIIGGNFFIYKRVCSIYVKYKGKGHPQGPEQAQGVPGIFLTFGTTRVVGRQPPQ